jgi:hypothetical protein
MLRARGVLVDLAATDACPTCRNIIRWEASWTCKSCARRAHVQCLNADDACTVCQPNTRTPTDTRAHTGGGGVEFDQSFLLSRRSGKRPATNNKKSAIDAYGNDNTSAANGIFPTAKKKLTVARITRASVGK